MIAVRMRPSSAKTDAPQRPFVLGVDLGQRKDYTAISVIERVDPTIYPATYRLPLVYHLRHLERLPLGTSYVTVADRIGAFYSHLGATFCELVVDASGVGRPVVDLLRDRGFSLTAVQITGGATSSFVTTPKGEDWNLPKIDLVGVLAVAFDKGSLKIPVDLPLAKALVDELRSFQVKITKAANETYSAREGKHDDLVLSVACAAWWAMLKQSRPKGYVGSIRRQV